MSKFYSSPCKLSTLIFISLLSFTSRSLCQIDSVHIHGEFNGLTLKKNSLITFHVNDFVLGKQLSFYSSIDSAGRFDIKFPMRCTQDIFWRYDEDSLFSLIVSPKDSLKILIDKAGAHFFGRNAKACEEINFMRKLNESAFPLSRENAALTH